MVLKNTKKEPQDPLSSFANQWLMFCGYNFLRLSDNKILRKGELFSMDPKGEYMLIPYAPPDGWENETEANEHFTLVHEIRKVNQIPDLQAFQKIEL